jgi:hypothetical protein
VDTVRPDPPEVMSRMSRHRPTSPVRDLLDWAALLLFRIVMVLLVLVVAMVVFVALVVAVSWAFIWLVERQAGG